MVVIVGAGLFGAAVAYRLRRANVHCMVIDKLPRVGGMSATEKIGGIDVHMYGAHIFHTNDEQVWQLVTELVEFNSYRHYVMAKYRERTYNMPPNLLLLCKVYGSDDASKALREWELDVAAAEEGEICNLERKAIAMVGRRVYETVIKEYTEKQWGAACAELPPNIITRLPVRRTYDPWYFDDRHQGIPVNGYAELFEKLLQGVDVRLNTDYFANREYFERIADATVFTGPIDRFYGYRYGKLAYRSLSFEHKMLEGVTSYQGCAVMNYIDRAIPYTRVIEHKHFTGFQGADTVVTFETPTSSGEHLCYPVNDAANNARYSRYAELARLDLVERKVIFGGRIGSYKYMNMDETIKQGLNVDISWLK
jgi:UDP-galactopyranose mutase